MGFYDSGLGAELHSATQPAADEYPSRQRGSRAEGTSGAHSKRTTLVHRCRVASGAPGSLCGALCLPLNTASDILHSHHQHSPMLQTGVVLVRARCQQRLASAPGTLGWVCARSLRALPWTYPGSAKSLSTDASEAEVSKRQQFKQVLEYWCCRTSDARDCRVLDG